MAAEVMSGQLFTLRHRAADRKVSSAHSRAPQGMRGQRMKTSRASARTAPACTVGYLCGVGLLGGDVEEQLAQGGHGPPPHAIRLVAKRLAQHRHDVCKSLSGKL